MENTPQQQLDLIAQMIKTAQRRFYDDSPFYILWGSTVMIASLVQYVLLLNHNEYNAIGWAILIPTAILLQLIFIRKQQKQATSKTHIEQVLNHMWFAFGICLFIVLINANKLQLNTYPIVLCLYAISTYISGSALKINAFIVGSIICWIAAVIAFFASFETQLLLLAAGVLFAYLIPGILLLKLEKEAA